MFDDFFEIEGIVPTIIAYIIGGVLMWFLALNKPIFSWSVRIMCYIVLIPISYFMINHYRNK
jgi:hypothetical protein